MLLHLVGLRVISHVLHQLDIVKIGLKKVVINSIGYTMYGIGVINKQHYGRARFMGKVIDIDYNTTLPNAKFERSSLGGLNSRYILRQRI